MTVDLVGHEFTNAGIGINGATVDAFPVATGADESTSSTSATASTTTDSSGKWAITGIADGVYDVRIKFGSEIRWLRGEDQIQIAKAEVSTAVKTQDAADVMFGSGEDALIRWSTGDADNHSLVIAVGDSNQSLHISDKGAVATDWDISATTHPNVYIHSNTTPHLDYLRLGDHDGTTAYVDVVGGTTLALEIAGNTELTVTSAGLNLPANSDISFTGTNGTNDIVLTNALADALSITDGSADIVVVDTSTTGNVITLTSALTVGVNDTGHDVQFFGATAGQYLLWDESADELVLAGDSKLSFHDAAGGENIIASANGHLEVNAGTTLDITAPTVDLNSSTEFNIDTAAYDLNASGAVTVDSAGISLDSSAASNLTTSGGALTITSAAAATWSTAAGALTVNGTAGINLQEGGATILAISDARVLATTNTASVDLDASGAIQVNSSGGAISVANDNIDQTVNLATAGTRTLNIGINDGTDVTTIASKGNVTQTGTLTVGVSDTGHDVQFFGATANTYMLWDENTDDLVLTLGAELYFYDAAGGEHIKSDGTDMTIYAGTDLNLTVGADINIATDKGLTFGDDGQKIESDGTDFTIASGAKLNLTPADGSAVHVANGTGVVIGHTAQIVTQELQVLGTASDDSSMTVARWSANASSGNLMMRKSRGGSIAAPGTAVVDNDKLGQVQWFGDDASNWVTGASIFARVNGTPGTNDMPTELVFATTADGANSVTERMRILADGTVEVVGVLSVDATTESTSTATGSIHTDGGMGVAKDLLMGTESTIIIGDTEDANVATGLIINMQDATDKVISLKQTNVGHPIADQAEPDTYGQFGQAQGGSGGLAVIGTKDSGGAAGLAVFELAYLGEAADTTNTSSGIGVIEARSHVTDGGSSSTVVASTGNVWTGSNAGTTRFIIKGNGDIHATNTTIQAMDDVPDALLMRAGRAATAPVGSFLHDGFKGLVEQYMPYLERHRIMFPDADEPNGYPMQNIVPSIMLAWDGLFQQMGWLQDIFDVLTPDQRARLPDDTRKMLTLAME